MINMNESQIITDKLRKLASKRNNNKVKYKKYNDKYINFHSTTNRIYEEYT